MITDTYKFENGKIGKCDFSNVKMDDLMRGPYIMRFACQGFNTNLYYAGDDETTWRRLMDDGKWAMHMSGFVDQMTHLFYYHDIDLRDKILSMTFSELNEKIKSLKNPQIIKNTDTFLDNPLE
jgi:hypothetical protein